MKLEHAFLLVNNFLLNFQFIIKFVNKFNNKFFAVLTSWKISSYADNYWFIYSNKKFLYELRSLNI